MNTYSITGRRKIPQIVTLHSHEDVGCQVAIDEIVRTPPNMVASVSLEEPIMQRIQRVKLLMLSIVLLLFSIEACFLIVILCYTNQISDKFYICVIDYQWRSTVKS